MAVVISSSLSCDHTTRNPSATVVILGLSHQRPRLSASGGVHRAPFREATKIAAVSFIRFVHTTTGSPPAAAATAGVSFTPSTAARTTGADQAPAR
ncbi:MAG: hypothetical protein BWX80_03011 [Candidatus Hydrogenedentes bacterium ADurb.Bin101]|nr:MAG: hypothetical protein BWX80_03011 [Candidatus Hydrogenedentes bacterium ADurb.Bin101]